MKFKSRFQAALFISGAVSILVMAVCLFLRDIGFFYSLGVTALTTLTHVLIRYLGAVLASIMPKALKDPDCPVYRVGKREQKLYRRLGLKKLKRFVPTYDPDEFDFSARSPEELLYNSCHAGMTHAIAAILSFAPILYTLCFGSFWVFFITSLLAFCFDGFFVLVQRYNRPRYRRLAGRMSDPDKRIGG